MCSKIARLARLVGDEAGGGHRHVASVNDDHLPGLHLALVGSVDEVERAGLRREHHGAVGAATHDQGPESERVAHG
jgi:hypothetical protein